MRRRALFAAAVALFAGLMPQAAAAHLVGVELGAFYAGSLHVLFGMEYLMVIMAVVLLSALQMRPAAGQALVALPAGVLLGSAIALNWPAAPDGMPAVFIVAAGIGLLCALAVIPRGPVFATLAALAGSCIGYSNVQALAGSSLDSILYMLGGAASAAVCLAIVAAVCVWLLERRSALSMVYRVMASWVTAFGLISFALGFATT